MPTFHSFAAFQNELHKLQVDLERDEARRIITEVGEKMQQIAERAASADLGGDPKFSGWAPILETKLKHLAPGTVILSPTRHSAGPWTVAESGRNRVHQGFAGPGINRRTGATSRTKSGGLRQARSFGKAKRWNGVTPAFHTASDAVSKFEKEMVKIVERGLHRVTKKHFD